MKVVSEPLPTVLNPELEAERRAALRALLRNPLLPANRETAKEYGSVRRHSAWLKHWFATFPQWKLHIDKGLARLHKIPADLLDETRAAVDVTSGSVFSRRRYALLCLALAALERSERQTTLGQIAERIMEFILADSDLRTAGLVFDISNHDQRRDLVHAVRLLLHLGLLRRIDGDEQQFLNRTGTSDALYEINRPILAAMLNVSHSPSALEASGTRGQPPRSLLERIGGIIHDAPAESDEARSRGIRSKLIRRLLDDPVLYLAELSDDERAYLDGQRGYLLRQIGEATGLIPEVRREGIAMTDDSGDLTDIKLPAEGTDGHLGLLLAAWLAERSRECPERAVPLSAVEEYIKTVIQVHGSRWRKAVNEPGAEVRVTEETLSRLGGLHLIRLTADGVIPLPAIGRYAASGESHAFM
jgi:uncharacterized protein (TIGR02678 family)